MQFLFRFLWKSSNLTGKAKFVLYTPSLSMGTPNHVVQRLQNLQLGLYHKIYSSLIPLAVIHLLTSQWLKKCDYLFQSIFSSWRFTFSNSLLHTTLPLSQRFYNLGKISLGVSLLYTYWQIKYHLTFSLLGYMKKWAIQESKLWKS